MGVSLLPSRSLLRSRRGRKVSPPLLLARPTFSLSVADFLPFSSYCSQARRSVLSPVLREHRQELRSRSQMWNQVHLPDDASNAHDLARHGSEGQDSDSHQGQHVSLRHRYLGHSPVDRELTPSSFLLQTIGRGRENLQGDRSKHHGNDHTASSLRGQLRPSRTSPTPP